MMSLKVITPKQGEKYYQKENYYSKEESKQNSSWYGRGADKLRLQGSVEGEDFSKLLHGELPNGEKFRTRPPTHDKYKERAGIDCTFSAPKSVSIGALVNSDSRLELAHREAVNTAMKVLEERYASTRVRTNGERQVVYTGNLIVGQFHHDSSREKDPQLHTHCVILNATQYNGKWYSLRNDEILSQQKLLGQIYQNELAVRVRKLGYEISQRENGQFEIKGYTEEQLKAFSKRREQILAATGENATSKERELATLQTRKPKGEEVSRSQLKEYWDAQAKVLNLKPPVLQKLGKGERGTAAPGERKIVNGDKSHSYESPSPLTLTPSPNKAIRQVDEAIEHCSERQVNFKREDLEKFIFSEIGNYSWKDIQQSIADNKNLLKAKENEYTTKAALNRELDSIRLVKGGKESQRAIATPETVESYLAEKELTDGQRQAISTALTTTDQFIAWQGKAGAGKTYALSEYQNFAQSRGYTIKGYAPSAAAAKVLGEELGVESTTVARLLVSPTPSEEKQQKQIWIVDEAGLLSAKDTYTLLQRASEERARILFVGDTRQLSAVEAGNPFKSLQQAGMTTAHLNQSLRQKTEDLKKAVDSISSGKISEGISILEANGRITGVGQQNERTEKIANEYIGLSDSERLKTLILAGTNQEKETIVEAIREKLKEEGTLGSEASLERLKTKDLTSVQMKYAHNYEKGDVVMPLWDYKYQGLKKGELYTVVHKNNESLTLQASDGVTVEVDPAKFHKAVYERREIEIAVGDRLKWTKNNRLLGRTNGQEFSITGIYGNTATIRSENGKSEQISLSQPQHLDHALVSTTYSSQGKTANRVLVAASSDRTLSKESFYVAASRAKYNLQIYVEDREKFVQKAQESSAKKNPIEVLDSQHRDIKRKLHRDLADIYESSRSEGRGQMADSRRDLEREDLDKKNANDEQNQQELIDNTEKQVTRRMKR
jgi:conjugative relaxase-like TrwC/TraI family protein